MPEPPAARAATVRARHRGADAVRVAALAIVVCGHWLLPVFKDDTTVRLALLVWPQTAWVTWLLQVLPVFFIVGGYANATSWRRATQHGEPAAAWAARRARRLLRPLVWLVAVWSVLTLLAGLLDVPADLSALASQSALVPAWFLAAYVVVTVATPYTLAADARWGVRVLLALAVATVLTDLVVAAGGAGVQWANTVWVWGGAHQLGLLWHRRGLPDPVEGALLAAAALAGLVVLTAAAGYPVDLVAEVDGATNATPPSLALFVLTVGQFGGLALLDRPLGRLLERPGPWRAVQGAGRWIMTVFLWHMTALVLWAVGLAAVGVLPLAEATGWGWAATRPLWLLGCALVCVPLVLLARPAERAAARPGTGVPGAGALVVCTAVVAGAVGVLAAGGLADPGGPGGLAIWPLAAAAAACAGLGVLDPPRPAPSPRPAEEVARPPTPPVA